MTIKYKILIGAIGLAIVMSVLVGFYYYTDNREDTKTVEYIIGMQKSPNVFMDIANDINVSSADDVYYIVRGKYNIEIHYGDQIIRMTKACFTDESYRALIAKIGLEVQVHVADETKNVEYHVTYWGTPVEEMARVN